MTMQNNTLIYVPKHQAYKYGDYMYIPSWFSYDDRPKKISHLLFSILSFLPFFVVNPFNGYLIKKNKWFREIHLKDWIYNPFEQSDSIIKEELNYDNL